MTKKKKKTRSRAHIAPAQTIHVPGRSIFLHTLLPSGTAQKQQSPGWQRRQFTTKPTPAHRQFSRLFAVSPAAGAGHLFRDAERSEKVKEAGRR